MTDSANVELVRSIHGAWERGDYSSAEWAHPHIELRLFKNGDHRLLAFKDQMAEAACAFFQQHAISTSE